MPKYLRFFFKKALNMILFKLLFLSKAKTICLIIYLILSQAKRVTIKLRLLGPHPNEIFRRFSGVTTPKQIYVEKKLCWMEASSTNGAQFHLYVNICPWNFSRTIFNWNGENL